MRRLRLLTGQHRTASINLLLGGLLAFNAGAVNAGGFLVVAMYTSHMTGFASLLADNLVLGNMKRVLGAAGTLAAWPSPPCRSTGRGKKVCAVNTRCRYSSRRCCCCCLA